METALKFIGIFASIFALYKIIVDVFLAKSTKRRDEYSFTKDFLCDLNREQIHPLIVEKGFLALSGMVLEEPEIRYILSRDNPSTLIDLRRNVSSFVSFNPDGLCYEWKGKYKGEMWQRFGSNIYFVAYWFFAMIGLIPLIMDNYKNLTNISVMIFCVPILIIAIASLIKHEDIKQATELFRH